MGFFRRLFGGEINFDSQREAKFRDLESKFPLEDDYLSVAKASWLVSRANNYGSKGNLERAILDACEAIKIKGDYVSAHLSLALAYRTQGKFQEALNVLNLAPRRMRCNNKSQGGYEFDIYSQMVAVYLGMADYDNALKFAKCALEVAQDPERVLRGKELGEIIPDLGGNDEQTTSMLQELIAAISAKKNSER